MPENKRLRSNESNLSTLYYKHITANYVITKLEQEQESSGGFRDGRNVRPPPFGRIRKNF